MKSVLANALVAGFLTLAGCSASTSTQPPGTGTGGNGDVPRGETNWPMPGTTPPTVHKPYPIVLAHGFSGFHNIGPLNYFYGVQDALSKDGHLVFVSQVDPYNSSEVRGAQLAGPGAAASSARPASPKVNLICHSQGALDCRYVANQLGEQIGAVVLVAGVNRGDYVADVAAGLIQGPTADAVQLLLSVFGSGVLDPGGNPNTDAKAAIAQLTTPGCEAFNAKYPDDPAVSPTSRSPGAA